MCPCEVVRIPGTEPDPVAWRCRRWSSGGCCKLPEVKEVFARTGTAEVATDLMPPSTSDGYVMLKPRKEWPDPEKPKADCRFGNSGGGRRCPGKRLWILATDPAAHERTDIRRPKRRRGQDIRRRSGCTGPVRGTGPGSSAEGTGRRGRQDRTSRGFAGSHGQAQPASPVALRDQRRRRPEPRRNCSGRQELRTGL